MKKIIKMGNRITENWSILSIISLRDCIRLWWVLTEVETVFDKKREKKKELNKLKPEII